MKKGCSPRKKYANGTANTGIGPNNYVEDPATALADYNIMLAKADAKALSNPWLPIVGSIGALGQGFFGSLASGSSMKHGVDKPVETGANGNSGVTNDIELEGGEMIETPQGQVEELQGPSHENGGMPMKVNQDIPEGTKVYSDRLKVGNKTLAERKATRERQIANIEKSVSKGADLAMKNAAQRKMKAIEMEEQSDLQFQEQVNNMVDITTSVMKAFGTGANGVTQYAGGGIIEYGKGYDEKTFQPYVDAYQLQNPGATFNLADFHKSLGIPTTNEGFGKVLGQGSFEAAQKIYGQDPTAPMSLPGNTNSDIASALNPFATTKEDAIIGATPEVTSNLDMGEAEKIQQVQESKKLNIEGIPGLGDVTGLVGNYLSSTAGLKTAAEQRSTDVAHVNQFKNAGQESLKNLDAAKAAVEGQKAAAISRMTAQNVGGKKGGRVSARGINQSRAMDWLYDTALTQSIADISTSAANQIAGIEEKKSGINLTADQLKGQGAEVAATANERAKDAYYTALGQGRADFGKGVQQTGKDINAIKNNEIMQNLLQQFGKYVTVDSKGNIIKKINTK